MKNTPYIFKTFLLLLVVTFFSGCAIVETPLEVEPVPVSEPVPMTSPEATEPEVTESEQADDTTISIAAVGDIMLGTDYPENRLPLGHEHMLLGPITPYLDDVDIAFGNFEGTFLTGGEPAKQCRDMSRCYLFRTPPGYVRLLVEAGFDVMSLANNHARDFDEQGRDSTMATLDAAGIHHSGRHGDVASWQVKGKSVAMIAYAPFKGSHNPLDIEAASEQVLQLATTHDIVIVSMHMGAEGKDALRIPFAEETFYGENRGDVVAFAHAMVDAGADVVIGHGPHVPRAVELYNDRLIAYSLGNFCTSYGINVVGLNGLAPVLRLEIKGDGSFISGEIISARQQRPAGPVLDASGEAAKLIAELTRLDFPDTGLDINEQGQILRRPETWPPTELMRGDSWDK